MAETESVEVTVQVALVEEVCETDGEPDCVELDVIELDADIDEDSVGD